MINKIIFLIMSFFYPVNADQATSFEALSQASDSFAKEFAPFPTTDNLIKTIGTTKERRREIAKMASTVRPIVHKSVIVLMNNFLKIKQAFGTPQEKLLYAGMTTEQFLDRLLKKRPLMFMNIEDDYLLRNGLEGSGGFEEIGTKEEKPPLVLKDYLSYDEMQLSALLSVSVPTYFINSGSRNNKGLQGEMGTYQERGIYTGMVGSRFEKPGLMEWAHIVITKEQNTSENGYGKLADVNNPKNQLLHLWAAFYNQGDNEKAYFPTFDEVTKDKTGRYIPIGDGVFFNSDVYKKRMRCSVEPFLVDANERAKHERTKGYVYAAATGLGVWLLHPIQKQLLLEVYLDVLNERQLTSLSDLQISWFTEEPLIAHHLQIKPSVKLHFTNRPPAAILTERDKGKLLIASYAWDGNAFPGNEYWTGLLNASGDPAAACCSGIPELQNPYINPQVSGKNTFIVESR